MKEDKSCLLDVLPDAYKDKPSRADGLTRQIPLANDAEILYPWIKLSKQGVYYYTEVDPTLFVIPDHAILSPTFSLLN
jgi:hypothetical protein